LLRSTENITHSLRGNKAAEASLIGTEKSFW
jgi:hypothetical protein